MPDKSEFANVQPPFAFDGADANADGILSLTEVRSYANQQLYRQMSLEKFFDSIDPNGDSVLSTPEIEAAYVPGQLRPG